MWKVCMGIEVLFDFDGDAADHEDDFVGMLGNVLIHPTLQVGELALKGVGAHTSRTNLVGHEDEGGILSGEAVKLGFESIKGFVNILQFVMEVGAPEGDAVDDSDTSCEVVATEVFLFFDIGPLCPSSCLMMEDTLTKLLVPHMGCRHIDGIGTEGKGKALCILAFARALATCDEDDFLHMMMIMMGRIR